jgi:hypothetical protein
MSAKLSKPRGRAVPPKVAAPVVTPASTWNANGLYRLPSGNVARLRRPGLLALAGQGTIPNPISAEVLRRITTDEPAPQTDEERDRIIRTNSKAYLEVAALALVEPRLIVDREPDHAASEIGPADLSDDDLLWIFYTFVQGGEHATAFRVG